MTDDERAAVAAACSDAPHARVLGVATVGGLAGVIIDADGWPQPDFVWCERVDVGWRETGGGSGRTHWREVEDGSGVLATWGQTDESIVGFEVRFLGRRWHVPVESGYWIWMADGVPRSAWDEPAEFVPVRSAAGGG